MTKAKKTEYRTFTPTELKNLVQLAQEFDQQAVDRLCSAFAPLIYKEARRSYITAALGEDAVNIAWEIFLEFIHNYKGNNYRLLPGLVQKHLYYELMHRVYRNNYEPEFLSLEAAADDKQLQIADEKQLIAKLDDELLVKKLLTALTNKQRQLIQAVFIQGLSLREYAQSQSISFTAAYKMQLKALSRLHKQLK